MKHLKTTWTNIRRSPYQAFAAILIMMLTFLVISFFTFLIGGSSKIVNYFEYNDLEKYNATTIDTIEIK